LTTFGVDGCRAGWLFFRNDDGDLSFGVVEKLVELVEQAPTAARIFIDIPIGLEDRADRPRACDVQARKLLGRRRGSSVFPAPIRAVLDEKDYATALRRSRTLTGKGLSRQAFAIVPKIREVDLLMQKNPRARRIVREVHPEVCFWALAGGVSMKHRKKRREGFVERINLLEKLLPGAHAAAMEALDAFQRKQVARDDIADALVATVTGSSPTSTLRTLPSTPVQDSKRLAMEIVCSASQLSTREKY
jgi:predicted RNase H-like nuclease